MKVRKTYRPEVLCCKDKKFHNLSDPYLNAAEGRLLATNGHALVSLPVETEKNERSRYVGRNLLKVGRALAGKVIDFEIEEDEIKGPGVLWPSEQMGRSFPDVAGVMPTFKRGDKGTITLTLNARLLLQVAIAMGHELVAITAPITRAKDGHSGALLVHPVDSAAEELGLLMPIGMGIEKETEIDVDQVCPKCGKVLAAGAHCPKHGDPKANRLEQGADEILKAAGSAELTRADTKGNAVARKAART